MSKIILHVGMKKTGSTALQEHFFKNREILNDKNILYYKPAHNFLRWRTYSNGHFLLADIIKQYEYKNGELRNSWIDENPIVNKEYIYNEIDSFKKAYKKYDIVILSEEMLSNTSFFIDDFWGILEERLRSYLDQDDEIYVICYIRRQDLFAYSNWKETVANCNNKFSYYKTLKEFEKVGMLDYKTMIDKIAKAFGKNYIIIRPYNKKAFFNNDIIDDFYNSCNIPIINNLIRKDGLTNTSFNTFVSQIIRYLNIFDPKKYIDRLNVQCLIGYRREFSNQDEYYYFPQSIKSRKKLIEKYRKDNDYICDEYCNKNNDSFIDYEIKDSKIYNVSIIKELHYFGYLLNLFASEDNPKLLKFFNIYNKVFHYHK